jgi:GT2 family glycosyltransferase
MHNKNNIPLISVIICSYNTLNITKKCLQHLALSIAKLGKPVETIVIENGNDGTGELIRKKYPWVKLIEPGKNTGFALGNNLGMAAANKDSKFILLLNSDALVNKNTLSEAVKYFNTNIECDLLGCKLLLEDGSLQASGGYLPTPPSVVFWIWGFDLMPIINKYLKSVHPKNLHFYDNDKKLGWVMGAFLFMKYEVYEKTHGMDENFFLYMEEVEWCKRINDFGFNIYFTPKFEITHLDKSSSKKDPLKFRQIFVRELEGIIYFAKKYYPAHIFWLTPAIKLGLVLRVVAFSLVGNNDRKLAYIEALKVI